MRHGFTTGSCSAAAAKAATYMLLGGRRKEKISIDTPAGIKYEPELEEITMSENQVSCAVRKDGGDDPDITSGALVFATVSAIYDGQGQVYIEGGKGVGRVTRPGLDQKPGNAAINSVPRQMIESEVSQVMQLFDFQDSVKVVISVPEGEEIARKTFNPRLGIEGGISIIGTSGIVEPMSNKAILDTIKVELRQKKEEGHETAVVSPGNYGLEFMKKQYGYDLDKAVKCSNFIGETIDMVKDMGFKNMILVGHIGKLIKVSGGIMNTHSKEADCRMELMAAAAAKSGASLKCVVDIIDSLTTEEAYKILINEGIDKATMVYIMNKINFYLNKRAGDNLNIQCIVYSNEFGFMGQTEGAQEMMDRETKND